MRITSQVPEQKTPGKPPLCRALHPEKCSLDNSCNLITSIFDTINYQRTQNTINNLKRSQLPDFLTTGFNYQGKDVLQHTPVTFQQQSIFLRFNFYESREASILKLVVGPT